MLDISHKLYMFLQSEVYYTDQINLISHTHNQLIFNVYDHEATEEYIVTIEPFERNSTLSGYSISQYNIRTNHTNHVYDIELNEL